MWVAGKEGDELVAGPFLCSVREEEITGGRFQAYIGISLPGRHDQRFASLGGFMMLHHAKEACEQRLGTVRRELDDGLTHTGRRT